MKYKIQLSMYGLVAERADIEIEAATKEEAEKIALKKADNCEIEFTTKNEAVDGWEYQVENTEEVKDQ